METQLDDVEHGTVEWVWLLSDFYNRGFKDSLKHTKEHVWNVKREEVPTEHVCEDCGEAMCIKWWRNGSFWLAEATPSVATSATMCATAAASSR